VACTRSVFNFAGAIVIIVVGMGGLAGTEIAPIVANRAFNSNSLTSSVVLSPFVDREALERTIAASRGLGVMSIQSDRMAHISNYNISRRLRIGLPLEQVLAAIDSEAIAAIKMFLVPPIGIGLSQ
jgi:cell division GTPase FtsZ